MNKSASKILLKLENFRWVCVVCGGQNHTDISTRIGIQICVWQCKQDMKSTPFLMLYAVISDS